MLRTAVHAGRSDLVHVVAVGRSTAQLPYAAELARAGSTLAFTRESTDDRPPGAPTAAEIEPLLAGREVFFVCGSSRFAGYAEQLLLGAGVDPTAIRVEQFGVTG